MGLKARWCFDVFWWLLAVILCRSYFAVCAHIFGAFIVFGMFMLFMGLYVFYTHFIYFMYLMYFTYFYYLLYVYVYISFFCSFPVKKRNILSGMEIWTILRQHIVKYCLLQQSYTQWAGLRLDSGFNWIIKFSMEFTKHFHIHIFIKCLW